MEILNRLLNRVRGGMDYGCVVVGGNEDAGPGELFSALAQEACTEQRTLIVLDAKQNSMERNDFVNSIVPCMAAGKTGYVFSPDATGSDAFDALSACDTTIEKASLIADLLIIHSMNPEFRGDVVTYFQYVMEITGKNRLKDILSMDPRALLAALSPSDPDAGMKQIFIDEFRTHGYRSVLSSINIFLHSPEAALMSGKLPLNKAMASGNVIVVSDVPAVTGSTVKNGLFRSVLLALLCRINRTGLSNGVILMRHADFIAHEDLEVLMNIAATETTLFVWMPENPAPFVAAGGGPILGRAEFLCVFRCDRISAETWSSMFGHSEQIKVSTTNSSPKSLLGALNPMNYVLGGMLAKSSPLRGSRSVTRSKEDQPNVPPELLSTLRYGKAWCRYPNGGFTEGKITRGWF